MTEDQVVKVEHVVRFRSKKTGKFVKLKKALQ